MARTLLLFALPPPHAAVRIFAFGPRGGWPTHAGAANLWIVAALGLLLSIAALTYRFIEKPGRALGRRIADQHYRRAQPSALIAVRAPRATSTLHLTVATSLAAMIRISGLGAGSATLVSVLRSR